MSLLTLTISGLLSLASDPVVGAMLSRSLDVRDTSDRESHRQSRQGPGFSPLDRFSDPIESESGSGLLIGRIFV